MRASQVLLALAACGAVVAGIATGCGGSQASTSTGSDSGSDVVTHETGAPEAGSSDGPGEAEASVVDVVAEAACVPEGSIANNPIPDASLGDAGATVSGCVSCIEAACPNLIAQCNASCACQQAFTQFEQCVGSGTSILTCGVDLTSAGLPLTDITCAAGCATPSICGFTIPTGSSSGGDSGSGSGGEGGGDTGASDATGQ